MIKLRSAIQHRSQQASDFFNCKTYVVPACFAVNRTDTMCHGTKSSYKTVFKRVSYLIIIKTTLEHLLLRHDLLLHKLSSIFDETFHHLAAVFYSCILRTFHINNNIPLPRNVLNSFLSNLANKNDIGFYLTKKLFSIQAELETLLSKFV